MLEKKKTNEMVLKLKLNVDQNSQKKDLKSEESLVHVLGWLSSKSSSKVNL